MRKVLIRPAAREDLATLREIESASGERFRDYGLDQVADNEPAPVEVLAGYADEGRAWVAVDDSGRPIGFILVDIIDAGGHIEQVSVAPAHQGQGVGRALIDQVKRWAISMNLAVLTLTTFGHIPWNRPLYEHLGFRVLSQNEISSGVQTVYDAEADHGLDPDLRVVMRLDLQA
jgi:GNAT superfamily N-acetyltransferase